jgi:predicted PurR-regulated permease PerM
VNETSPLLVRRVWGRRIFLAVSAIVVVSLVIVAHAVMLPFVLALVVAYVLTPAVVRVERRRVPRWASILLVYALTLGVVGGFVSAIVPRLVAEGRSLAAEWPNLNRRMREEWLPSIDVRLSRWSGKPVEPTAPELREGEPLKPEEKPPMRIVLRDDGSYDVVLSDDLRLHEVRSGTWKIESEPPPRGLSSATVLREGFDKAVLYMRQNALEILKIGQIIAGAISRAIFTLFMTLMLAAYIILTHERILAFFRSLWLPEQRPSFDIFLRRLDRGLSGVVRGQLLICLVNGVLSAIGFAIVGLKYWPVLALVATVLSLIPIFGSIISAIPAVILGLTQSFGTAVFVLVWIVGIHQLEANLLNPKIMGDAAKIHPLLVVFSLLVGEHFFGVVGALLAVPLMSIAQNVFLHAKKHVYASDPELAPEADLGSAAAPR